MSYPFANPFVDTLPVFLDDYLKKIAAYSFEKPKIPLCHDPLSFRDMFVADTHFGTRVSMAMDYYQFRRHFRSPSCITLGDACDFHALGIRQVRQIWKLMAYTAEHPHHAFAFDEVFHYIKRGGKEIIVPGNHDPLWEFLPYKEIYGIALAPKSTYYRAGDGRTFLLTHGDCFDGLMAKNDWLGLIGTKGFSAFIHSYNLFSRTVKKLGLNRWVEMFRYESLKHVDERLKSYVDGRTFNVSFRDAIGRGLIGLNVFNYMMRKANPGKAAFYPIVHGAFLGHAHLACCDTIEMPVNKETGEPMGEKTLTFHIAGHWSGNGQGEAPHYNESAGVVIAAENEPDENGQSVFNFYRFRQGEGLKPYTPQPLTFPSFRTPNPD